MMSDLSGRGGVKRSPAVLSMAGNADSTTPMRGVGRSPLILAGGLRGGGKFNFVQKNVRGADGVTRMQFEQSAMSTSDEQSPFASNVRSNINPPPVRVVGRGGTNFSGQVVRLLLMYPLVS